MVRRNSNSTYLVNTVSACYRSMLRTLLLLLGFYLFCQLFDGDDRFYTVINGIAPVFLILALLLPTFRLVRVSPDTIWSPAVWLPVSSALFFGLGPLVEVFGNDLTLKVLGAGRLAVSPYELFRVHILSTVGIYFTVMGFWGHTFFQRRTWRNIGCHDTQKPFFKTQNLAVVFIIFGAIIQYILIKPSSWGVSNITIPGMVGSLGVLLDVGYGMIAFFITRNHSVFLKIFFCVTWPLHLLASLASFEKTGLVIALFMPAIGAYLKHKKINHLIAYFFVISIAFFLYQPLVGYGRSTILNHTGTIDQAGYVERFDILNEYFFDHNSYNGKSEERFQEAWARLNYAGPQAFVMNQYDSGRHGSTLKNAWMYFVPRVIWPNKPIMVGPGADFYAFVTGGNATTFLGLSVYGDLYWQFGWMGIVLICPLIGWFFAMMAWRSVDAVESRKFIMMPVILIALEASLLGMTKYLLNGIISAVPLYYSYLLSVNIATIFIKKIKVMSL